MLTEFARTALLFSLLALAVCAPLILLLSRGVAARRLAILLILGAGLAGGGGGPIRIPGEGGAFSGFDVGDAVSLHSGSRPSEWILPSADLFRGGAGHPVRDTKF